MDGCPSPLQPTLSHWQQLMNMMIEFSRDGDGDGEGGRGSRAQVDLTTQAVNLLSVTL